jgi:hypothetical protein
VLLCWTLGTVVVCPYRTSNGEMGETEQSEELPRKREETSKAETETEKSGGLRGILIPSVFTFLGAVVGVMGRGYYDLAVEKEKSHTEQTTEERRSASALDIEKTKVEADIQLEREKFESNRKIERQKLDEDLIKLALQSSEIDKRTEALRFMVETGLIADSDIKQGVEHYLAEKKPVPGLALSVQHGNTTIEACEDPHGNGVVIN